MFVLMSYIPSKLTKKDILHLSQVLIFLLINTLGICTYIAVEGGRLLVKKKKKKQLATFPSTEWKNLSLNMNRPGYRTLGLSQHAFIGIAYRICIKVTCKRLDDPQELQ